jgi:hypothetical protein
MQTLTAFSGKRETDWHFGAAGTEIHPWCTPSTLFACLVLLLCQEWKNGYGGSADLWFDPAPRGKAGGLGWRSVSSEADSGYNR